MEILSKLLSSNNSTFVVLLSGVRMSLKLPEYEAPFQSYRLLQSCLYDAFHQKFDKNWFSRLFLSAVLLFFDSWKWVGFLGGKLPQEKWIEEVPTSSWSRILEILVTKMVCFLFRGFFVTFFCFRPNWTFETANFRASAGNSRNSLNIATACKQLKIQILW